MPNASTNPTVSGGRTNIPAFVTEGVLTIDTYTTGGVDLFAELAKDQLASEDNNYKAAKLKTADIYDGLANTGSDTEGIKYIARYDKTTGKIILILLSSGAEPAAGAITAVDVNYTLFQR